MVLEWLNDVIWERIDSHYDWVFFELWIGDESNLGRRYKESFEEIIEGIHQETLTEIQKTLLEKKGENLETMICKWCYKWKLNHPDVQNQKLPKSCLKIKIYEYIIYQLNKPDLRQIIGPPC